MIKMADSTNTIIQMDEDASSFVVVNDTVFASYPDRIVMVNPLIGTEERLTMVV